MSATKLKAPARGWIRCPSPPQLFAGAIWQEDCGDLQVVSSVDVVEDLDSPLALPAFHVSAVARRAPGRVPEVCTDEELSRVRQEFQMDDADEDNHGRGVSRHLWLRVGALAERPCACKKGEDTRAEDGREWRP